MEKLLSKLTVSALIVVNYSCNTQSDKMSSINIEDIKIGPKSIVENIDSSSQYNFYRYINKEYVVEIFGNPDQTQVRNDELMETKILRMIYGKSYIEFYDHTFGEVINQDQFSLYSINFIDPKLWITYRGDILRVGEEFPDFYKQLDENGSAIIILKRGLLNETSDYVLKVEFQEKFVKKISAIFD